MKTVFITGAGGFLGKYLIKALQKENDIIIYAFTNSKEELTLKYSSNTKIYIYDSKDWDNKRIPFTEIDTIIHCAFSRSNKGIDLTESLIFADKVFQKAIKYKYNVINISSRSVYGQNPNIPWYETTQPDPDNLYAFAKLCSELLLERLVSSSQNIAYTNIRLAGLVGNELPARIINKLIDNVLKNNTINIKGGKQQFAYIDVRDAADGIIALLKTPTKRWRSVYNLGFVRSYNIFEIAETVARVATKYNCPNVNINIEKTEDSLYAEIDSSLFYSATKWKPQYDMEAIVDNMFKFMLNKK